MKIEKSKSKKSVGDLVSAWNMSEIVRLSFRCKPSTQRHSALGHQGVNATPTVLFRRGAGEGAQERVRVALWQGEKVSCSSARRYKRVTTYTIPPFFLPLPLPSPSPPSLSPHLITQCELYHWTEVLDRFDSILSDVTHHEPGTGCIFMCPKLANPKVCVPLCERRGMNKVSPQ